MSSATRTQKQARIARIKLRNELYHILKFNPPIDGQLSLSRGEFHIDIAALDKELDRRDPEYDHVMCTYRGKTCSQEQYIARKYSKRAAEIVKQLI